MQWFVPANKDRKRSPTSQMGSHPPPFGKWAAAGLCASLGLYALALAYEGMRPTAYTGRLTGPIIDNASAERAYDALPAGAAGLTRLAAARRLIQGDPANAAGWVETAYADGLVHGRMTAEGENALEHSYEIAYFDRGVSVRRISIGLENWHALTADCRSHVLAEARLALRDRRLRDPAIAQLRSVHDPAGRLAARILLLSTPGI